MLKTYFQALAGSFYDFNLYRAVIRRWDGLGALYMLLVAAVGSFLLVATVMQTIHSIDEQDVERVLGQMPEIIINQGVAVADQPTPKVIDLYEGRALLYMDLNETPDPSQALQTGTYEAALKLYREFFEIHYPDGSIKTFPLSDFPQVTVINRDILRDTFERLQWILPLTFWPMIFGGTWLMYLLYTNLIALMSYFMTAPMTDEFDYNTRLRMSAIAMTPPILLNAVAMIVMNHNIHLLFQMLIAMIYLYTMIRVNRSD